MQAENRPEELIYQLIEQVRQGYLPRRRFMRMLARMGISAVGVGAISSAILSSSAVPLVVTNADERESHNLHLHDQHLQYQSQGQSNKLSQDYAENALVEDSMYDTPLIGRAAIMTHKEERMGAVSNAQINVTNRVARSEQVIVEWVATGTHSGDLYGMPATNRPYCLHGVTVVIRRDGKIVRESLYYNPQELRRQLS